MQGLRGSEFKSFKVLGFLALALQKVELPLVVASLGEHADHGVPELRGHDSQAWQWCKDS